MPAEVIRRRTEEERRAYLQGYEAGAREAARYARSINFSDVAERTTAHIESQLVLMGVLEPKETT